MDKQKFRNYIIAQMEAREWRQGDLFPAITHAAPPAELTIHPVITDDGSITFWNDHVKEHYHTRTGARLEAEEKYVQPAHLHKQLQHKPLHLLDICFGLGYNSYAALNAAFGATHPLQDAVQVYSSTLCTNDSLLVASGTFLFLFPSYVSKAST